MTSAAPPSLGVLNLERGVPPGVVRPPRPGSPLNPATYNFPVILETVEGAWVDRVLPGDPSLEPACVAAAGRLVERGAVAITANCGFFIRHQAAISAAVKVPVATSALLLLPALLRQVPQHLKIAVLTADSACLSEDLLLGAEGAAERARIVIGGTEGGDLWHNEMKRPPVPTELSSIEKDVVNCISRLRGQHRDIGAILLECTGFPIVATKIREFTRLPVYDLTTLVKMTLASVGAPRDA